MATRRKLPQARGHKISPTQVKAGAAAMSKAMTSRVTSTKASKEKAPHKIKKF